MTSQPNFNTIARPYRWLEYLTLGPILQQTRTHFLPHLTDRRHILALGDGDGRFLAKLLAVITRDIATRQVDQGFSLRSLKAEDRLGFSPQVCFPDFANEAEALAVDISATMLALLHQRCPQAQTLHANALDITIPPSTDLITTHFFLDCLAQAEVDTLTQRIAAATRPGTLWVLSDFAIPANPLAPIARLYIRSLYLAFRILTNLRITHLPNPQSALNAAGFTLLHRHQRLFGLIYTEIWQLQ